MQYDAVVLSGGGTKGILTLGALYYYYEKGTYHNEHVKTYSATSIGSAISLLLLCGYTPMDIFMEVYKTRDIFKIPSNISILDIVKNMGILPIESFSDKIKELIRDKLGFIPTLSELHELTGKKLIVTASNVAKVREEHYEYETHADLSALHAIELSCCLPIIFHRIKYDGDYITDGGLSNNFPIDQADNETNKILAIVTLECENTNHPDELPLSESQEIYGDNPDNFISDFLSYFYKLTSLPIKTNNELRMKLCGPNVTLIKIKYCTNIFELSTSEEKKMDMFTVGYQTAEYKDKVEYLYVEELWSDVDSTTL